MPVITVVKPFGLRLGSGRDRRDFAIGEHVVSDEELAHWFVQACLKDGRAVLAVESVPEEETAPEGAGDGQAPAGEDRDDSGATKGTAEGDDEPEDDAAAGEPETGEEKLELFMPAGEELSQLTAAKLRELAALCGASVTSGATKAMIVRAILEANEAALRSGGEVLCKTPDGEYGMAGV